MSVKRALAIVGAVAAAVCGILILWDVVVVIREFYPLFMAVEGSGGVGAVSAAAGAQISIALLGLIPSVVVNRGLARRACQAQGRLRWLHRLHSWLLLAVAVGAALVVLPIQWSAFYWVSGMFAIGLLTLAAIGVQFLVLAGMLLVIA